MLIIITGTPGTGKTTIAKKLSKKLGFDLINEKDFALNNGLANPFNGKEIEIDVNDFKKMLLKAINGKKVILEGHLLCEISLPADLCVVLTAKPKIIEERLKKRKYSDEKILDNMFCEEINYCLNKAKKKYLYITKVDSSVNPDKCIKFILNELMKKNLI
jgi:adenylate kinase